VGEIEYPHDPLGSDLEQAVLGMQRSQGRMRQPDNRNARWNRTI